MPNIPHRLRKIFAAGYDTSMAATSLLLALYLRLGDERLMEEAPYLWPSVASFTCICLLVFIGMRLYRSLWRYASMEDLIQLTKAVTIAIAAFAVLMFVTTRLEGFPRSVLLINWLLLLALLGLPRFAYRALNEHAHADEAKQDSRPPIPVLLLGATDQAELFIRETVRAGGNYCVVGIVDDRAERHNRSMRGIRIYGGSDALPAIVHKLAKKNARPQRLIIADDTVAGERLQNLLEITDRLGLTLGRLPRLSEFKQGVSEKTIRAVAIEDLLGRAQNMHANDALTQFIQGTRVLITGAGGSIGSELCRQVARYRPAQMVLFEQSEYALYLIDQEIACEHAPIIGDVRNAEQVEKVFSTYKPDIVFHAAAIKHVPLAERNPLEALQTNVLGTLAIAEACVRHRAAAMVLISSDKAVHPTSIMGASKRFAEMVCQQVSAGAEHTRFITVRFGNVLGSTGSVVPLFERQLKAGGPLTVTHPEMTRYFMTIREAVELVMQAADLGCKSGRNNSIFVLDMGTPIRIVDLAKQMIRLADAPEVEIAFIGLRPGEKLYEELFYAAEDVLKTAHPGIMLAKPTALQAQDLQKSLDLLAKLCRERSAEPAVALLKTLVPEYLPNPAFAA